MSDILKMKSRFMKFMYLKRLNILCFVRHYKKTSVTVLGGTIEVDASATPNDLNKEDYQILEKKIITKNPAVFSAEYEFVLKEN